MDFSLAGNGVLWSTVLLDVLAQPKYWNMSGSVNRASAATTFGYNWWILKLNEHQGALDIMTHRIPLQY